MHGHASKHYHDLKEYCIKYGLIKRLYEQTLDLFWANFCWYRYVISNSVNVYNPSRRKKKNAAEFTLKELGESN